MKKTLSLLLCIILISCLVSCDLSMIWNSIKGTIESTTTTTTTTTTAPLEYTNDSEYETLEDLLTSIEYDYATCGFRSGNFSLF